MDLHAIDGDLMQDDHIGTCTVQGTPAVDDRGYVNAESFTCHGQFWAVVVRLRPVESAAGGGLFPALQAP